MKREQILNKAKVLISGERAIDYGDAYVQYVRKKGSEPTKPTINKPDIIAFIF